MTDEPEVWPAYYTNPEDARDEARSLAVRALEICGCNKINELSLFNEEHLSHRSFTFTGYHDGGDAVLVILHAEVELQARASDIWEVSRRVLIHGRADMPPLPSK